MNSGELGDPDPPRCLQCPDSLLTSLIAVVLLRALAPRSKTVLHGVRAITSSSITVMTPSPEETDTTSWEESLEISCAGVALSGLVLPKENGVDELSDISPADLSETRKSHSPAIPQG